VSRVDVEYSLEDIEVRGLTFPYRISGPPEGREVLLLHGFPEYSLEWAAQVEALARSGFLTVAPDQRGYGPGNQPSEVSAYRMDELVADVIALLDALGWARVDLIGHDWGGAVAWHVACRHPERLRSLTAVSTPHPLAIQRARGSGGSQRQMSSYMEVFRQPGVAEDALLADDAAALRALYGGLPETDHYVERFQDRRTLTSALNWYRAMSGDDNSKAHVVQVPTLYVWGEADMAFSREAAEAVGDFVDAPYTFAPLEGAGHWVPETHAAQLNRLILDHLLQHYL
jgi:pimeloyl-ACP methyl ester carboxylesterase